MKTQAVLIVALCLAAGCRTARPLRVAPKQLARLANGQERFVLIFGSVRAVRAGQDVTREGGKAGAAIRFLDEGPQPVLLDIPIVSGQRFYAVLRPPQGKNYVDQFDAAVRWMDPEYDKVTHMKLKDQPPYALYIGELDLELAELTAQRLTPQRILSVSFRNEFPAASQELKRLYPQFRGEVVRAPMLTARPSSPPARVR